MKLYELSENYKNLEILLDNEEVDLEMVQNALDEVMGDIKSKVEGICMIIRDKESDIDIIDAEIKRLQALKKSKTSQKDFLKTYVSDMMQYNDFEKIDTGLFRVGFRNSTSVNVWDETLIPEDFVTTTTTIKPNKKEIGEILRQGGEVPGCNLELNKNLQIK